MHVINDTRYINAAEPIAPLLFAFVFLMCVGYAFCALKVLLVYVNSLSYIW